MTRVLLGHPCYAQWNYQLLVVTLGNEANIEVLVLFVGEGIQIILEAWRIPFFHPWWLGLLGGCQ